MRIKDKIRGQQELDYKIYQFHLAARKNAGLQQEFVDAITTSAEKVKGRFPIITNEIRQNHEKRKQATQEIKDIFQLFFSSVQERLVTQIEANLQMPSQNKEQLVLFLEAIKSKSFWNNRMDKEVNNFIYSTVASHSLVENTFIKERDRQTMCE